jgi:transporter family protein
MNSGIIIGVIVLLLTWGVYGVTAKLAVKEIGLQIVVWTQLASLAIFPLYFLFFKELLPLKLQPNSIILALITGALGIGGTLILYLLLRAAPASIAIPLSALYPLVTVILSYFILREQITIQQWLGIIFALAAIALLTIDFTQFFPKPQ